MAFLLTAALRIGAGAASRIRHLFYSALGVRFDGPAWLRGISIPRQWSDIRVEKGVALDDGVTLICSSHPKPSKIQIGARTYINRHSILDASESLVIGEDCMIGPGCYLTDHDHGIAPGLPPAAQELISRPTRLGKRVWLGANVTILKGVSIGDDAVVGAGSIVTHDVPSATVVAGNPAKPLQRRPIMTGAA